MRDYQLYLKIERGLSQNTIDSYYRDLEKLLLFLEEHEIDSSPISVDKIIGYFLIHFKYRQSYANTYDCAVINLRSKKIKDSETSSELEKTLNSQFVSF
ncbi:MULTISPECIES: site-specific integrase [unclassified Polaribacter]|uniref:site-specific integrase n=1 Tax=unclassified Polaribacter TaxID=196858 RepID=UPI0021D01795|nr:MULTISPECIES: site-specific integrase [unclassified Polaribacter]